MLDADMVMVTLQTGLVEQGGSADIKSDVLCPSHAAECSYGVCNPIALYNDRTSRYDSALGVSIASVSAVRRGA